MLSLPFAFVGGIWYLWLAGYNMSVAVWVGFIALAGEAAETGVVMLLYLDEAYAERRRTRDGVLTAADVADAVREGAVERLRPKLMTALTIVAGFAPILWSQGAGADVMKRIAAPMMGGMITSTVLTLVVIPAIYLLWRRRVPPYPPGGGGGGGGGGGPPGGGGGRRRDGQTVSGRRERRRTPLAVAAGHRITSRRVPAPGLAYQVTAMVCQATGGPCTNTRRRRTGPPGHGPALLLLDRDPGTYFALPRRSW
jgi:hypothetical protein